MQILHPFAGSFQSYDEEISDPNRYRPDHCPQCEAKHPLTGHGFYCRTLVDAAFDGVIRVRRYLCRSCKRTVSLLPEFAFPWLRFSVSVIALFLVARLLNGLTLAAAETMAQNVPFLKRSAHFRSLCMGSFRGGCPAQVSPFLAAGATFVNGCTVPVCRRCERSSAQTLDKNLCGRIAPTRSAMSGLAISP